MWNFLTLQAGQLERSPHEAEFFNVGDIDKATAIVREVIQNSLDAKLQNGQLVNVKFIFGSHKKSVDDVYYQDLLRHVKACDLPTSSWDASQMVKFLTIEDFFTGFRGEGASAMAVVMYGNRAYEDALLELKLKLEERNFVVRAAAAFIGEHSVSRNIAAGRPDQKDLGIAFEYGGKVARYVQSEAYRKLVVPGSYPFVAKGSDPHYFPSTTSACIHCGLCAGNCPYEALDTEDFRTVDKTKCMRCGRCVKYCPSNAKVFDDPDFLARLPEFEARLNSNACQPGLFLPSSS